MSKGLTSEEALCYLDDIAHGRKMKYDAHELKLIIEKELKALEIIKKSVVEMTNTKVLMSEYYRVVLALNQKEYDLLKEVLNA